jgi:hypothetical protein
MGPPYGIRCMSPFWRVEVWVGFSSYIPVLETSVLGPFCIFRSSRSCSSESIDICPDAVIFTMCSSKPLSSVVFVDSSSKSSVHLMWRMLPSGSPTLYYILNAQLFRLRLKRTLTEHTATVATVEAVFDSVLPGFRKKIAFWRVPRLRLFVFMVRTTCRWRWIWSVGGMVQTGESRSTRRKT